VRTDLRGKGFKTTLEVWAVFSSVRRSCLFSFAPLALKTVVLFGLEFHFLLHGLKLDKTSTTKSPRVVKLEGLFLVDGLEVLWLKQLDY
jgi:hypothetical protein